MKQYIGFNYSCTACMTSVKEKQGFEWASKAPLVSLNYLDDAREFSVIEKLKSIFITEELKCNTCGKTGAFDIWDVTVNDVILYSAPSFFTSTLNFKFLKRDNEEDFVLDIKHLEEITKNVTMFDFIMKKIDEMDKVYFIENDFNQFFYAIVCSNAVNQKPYLNFLRHAGFSKKNLLELITISKSDYLSNYASSK